MARRIFSPATQRGEQSAAVVDLLLRIAGGLQHRIEAEVAALGLTPAVGRALYELDPDRPVPARDLAASLACDRSNITGLVDRLEQAGLVRRQIDPADRRIKTLVVTEAGRQVQRQMRQAIAGCGDLLSPLSDRDLVTLRRLCSALLTTLEPGPA
ncbi:MAG TPA: MarR family transcriptional regulator [Rugosimonospora sp.]|nr:MarR family transcriptional regulator [Rugosimonospora sp.]